MGRRDSLLESCIVGLTCRFAAKRGLTTLRSLPWDHFKMLVSDGFRRRGYSVAANAETDGDADLVLRKDGGMFLVQCRQRALFHTKAREVRELAAIVASRSAQGGFLVTTGKSKSEVQGLARQSGIELIDGPGLERMVWEAQSPEPFMDPTVGRRRLDTNFREQESRR